MKEFFYKYNHLDNNSLLNEVKGLELLKKTLENSNNSYIKIPKIYNVKRSELQIENINSSNANPILMKTLGVGLARLHELKFEFYGFEEDNFIGLNPQKNILSDNWGEFFFECRLMYQVMMIENLDIKEEFIRVLSKNRNTLVDFLNENIKHASLVHGDLWSGNALFDKNSVYLIDPAVYYADREVDIAMTELFGGFSKEFYDSYKTTYPLSKEYKKKKIIYNFYHYLNHYNLFGSSYLNSCEKALIFISKL